MDDDFGAKIEDDEIDGFETDEQEDDEEDY